MWIFLKLFSFQKSTFSTANGCCCIFMNGYFLLFNCYFSHLGFIIGFYSQVFPFAPFHSNTIINVFIDFSLRYRLLLYRKPAFKKKWRRDDFIPNILWGELRSGRQRHGVQKHFLFSSMINNRKSIERSNCLWCESIQEHPNVWTFGANCSFLSFNIQSIRWRLTRQPRNKSKSRRPPLIY